MLREEEEDLNNNSSNILDFSEKEIKTNSNKNLTIG
jgi:hypothetical protein